MKIERIINGQRIEIELTNRELFNAYCEQEHEFNMEDVRAMLGDDFWDWGEDKPELTDKQISRVAAKFQERLENNDYVSEIRWDIIYDTIKEALK